MRWMPDFFLLQQVLGGLGEVQVLGIYLAIQMRYRVL